jgi:hypothetical protein
MCCFETPGHTSSGSSLDPFCSVPTQEHCPLWGVVRHQHPWGGGGWLPQSLPQHRFVSLVSRHWLKKLKRRSGAE